MALSVVPEWIFELPFQQQSILLLSTRGPDGVAKNHPCKQLVRVFRGTLFKHARYGRMSSADWGSSEGDTFSDRRMLGSDNSWYDVCSNFLRSIDELPLHYVMHFMHAVEILGYKCPDKKERQQWHMVYLRIVNELHLEPETESTMDRRLDDFGRTDWTVDLIDKLPALTPPKHKQGQRVFELGQLEDYGSIEKVYEGLCQVDVQWVFSRDDDDGQPEGRTEYVSYRFDDLIWSVALDGWTIPNSFISVITRAVDQRVLTGRKKPIKKKVIPNDAST